METKSTGWTLGNVKPRSVGGLKWSPNQWSSLRSHDERRFMVGGVGSPRRPECGDDGRSVRAPGAAIVNRDLVLSEALLAGRRVQAQVQAARREARLERLAMERLAKRMKTRRPMPPSKFPVKQS